MRCCTINLKVGKWLGDENLQQKVGRNLKVGKILKNNGSEMGNKLICQQL